MKFKLRSNYQPRGDQPAAIEQLCRGLEGGDKHQVLLGVTGSGKTFTMAKLIELTNRPTLVLAHNKTLAAQLYHEFRAFFPENAVEYFVSYYDYYQPEAYVPSADIYIDKEARTPRRGDRGVGVVHLRLGLAGSVLRNAGDAGKGAANIARGAAAAARGRPVRAVGGFAARNISRARGHDRNLSYL